MFLAESFFWYYKDFRIYKKVFFIVMLSKSNKAPHFHYVGIFANKLRLIIIVFYYKPNFEVLCLFSLCYLQMPPPGDMILHTLGEVESSVKVINHEFTLDCFAFPTPCHVFWDPTPCHVFWELETSSHLLVFDLGWVLQPHPSLQFIFFCFLICSSSMLVLTMAIATNDHYLLSPKINGRFIFSLYCQSFLFLL